MSEETSVRFKLDKKEYYAFNVAHSRVARRILPLFYFVVFVITISLTSEEFDEFTLSISAIAGIFLIVIIAVVQNVLLRLRTNKVFATDTLIQKEQQYRFESGGFDYKASSSTGYIEWKDVYKVVESRDLFLIYLAANKSLVIPKRAFESEASSAAFRSIVHNSLDKKKVKLKG